jgi:hypothetical protein
MHRDSKASTARFYSRLFMKKGICQGKAGKT